MFGSFAKRTLLLITPMLFAIFALACSTEEHCHATMTRQNPPAIKFSFTSFIDPATVRIRVEEVAISANGEKYYGDVEKLVWDVKLKKPGAFRSWPIVIYGQVPLDGEQLEPKEGSPRPLSEGRIYRCLVLGRYWPDLIFFKVEGNKITEVYGAEAQPLPDYARKHIEE